MGTRWRLLRLEQLEDRHLLSASPPADPWPVLPSLPAQVDGSWTWNSSSAFFDSVMSRPPAVPLASPAAADVENTGVFRIYVEQGILSQIQAAIDTYTADLANDGYQVTVEEFFGTAAQLRSSLQNHWVNDHLEGAVFVGDLPSVRFTSRDQWDGIPQTATYLHDMYFMDLDGTYEFNPGGVDSHTGQVEPDIYVSRITTGNLGGVTGRDEVTLINKYFAKVHAYRTGQLTFADKGIVFKDDDWASAAESGKADLFMSSAYRDVLTISDAAQTTKQGYLDTLQVNAESTLEMIHSGPTAHALTVGSSAEWITSQEIVAANPRQGFYNLFNCSAADYEIAGNLIGSYVYGGSYGLNAVGSTKTGSMLDYQIFYESQGQGESVGQAFRDWYRAHTVPSQESAPSGWVDWLYGMAMQGDPTLEIRLPPTATLVDPSPVAAVQDVAINTRRTIDVAFADAGGSGLDLATITDAAAEFTFGGTAASGVVVNGVPKAIGGNVYRYSFTGSFAAGPVSVNFIEGAFADNLGAPNNVSSLQFTVQPTLSLSGVAMREGNSATVNANFTVTLSGPYTEAVTVNYATQDGTASAGSDYSAVAGTLTFLPGETRKIIPVGVHGDKWYEASETFTLNLSDATGVAIVRGTATGAIYNDDAAPRLSIGKVSLAEGDAATTAFVFNVDLSTASGGHVTVHYGTQDGTAAAGSDFTAVSGDLTFLPGQTRQTITVEVNGDASYERQEKFSVKLSSPQGATIARRKDTGTGTILNDDARPTVSVGDARLVPTGTGTSAEFIITLSAPSGVATSVKIATANGTAKSRYDFKAVSQKLVFDAGQTSISVFVPILSDLSAATGKTFFLVLSRPQQATLGAAAKGTCTIQPLVVALS